MRLLRLFAVVAFVALTQNTYEVAAADDISYIGAVVEYYPVTSGINGTTIATANANNYVTIIERASNYSTDIIVFPESSLTQGLTPSGTNRTLYPSHSSFIPDPDTDIPCENATTVVIEALQLISCAAKNYSMYVVVNLHEMENCSTTGTTTRPCPSDGYFFYNTNVVFNRTGGIIARYRKYNLFGEAGFNTTETVENSTFTSDFNVTFGQFICFDLLFKTPALSLVNDHNVTDVLFSAHWFSELPYLTTIQIQSAWAYANNVNLLASAYNTPATGSGGSGIYAGTDGNLTTLFSENATNTLLVARIPYVSSGVRNYTGFNTSYPVVYTFNSTEITTLEGITTVAQQTLLRDDLSPYNTTLLSLTDGTNTTAAELCDHDLCCSFYVNATFNETIANTSSNYYRYRLSVFDGVRTFSGMATGGTQHCSVIACINDTLTGCGVRFDANDTVVYPTTLNSIVIHGNFSTNDNILAMPDSLTTSILPLNVTEFTYVKTNFTGTTLANITYTLTANQSELLTFAIYARNFTGDGLNVTTVTSVPSTSSAFSSQLPATTSFVLSSLIIIKNLWINVA